MKHMPSVMGSMTPFPHAIDVEAPLTAAREMMRERGFRHLPVISEGRLLGILSDRDIKLALGPDLGYAPEGELKVRDVYLADAYTVDGHTPLDQVAGTMAERHIGAALVTQHGRLAGVFTSTDACRALARFLRERFPPHAPGSSAA